MTVAAWQPGTLYNPGAVVRRNSTLAVVSPAPVNPDFELGDTDWTKGANWTIGTQISGAVFSGTKAARCTASAGTSRIYQSATVAVVPGMSITASCQVRRGKHLVTGRVELEWLDAMSQSIAVDQGTLIDFSEDKWKQSTVTAIAPALAAYVRLGATATFTGSCNIYVDAFQWNYAYQPPLDSVTYQAVQADAGYSGSTEPTWPSVLGQQVVDNEVTWEAVDSSFVTWEAAPILVSGASEPTFPDGVGDTVADNTIVWAGISRRISDTRCPNNKVVAIAASKVFAGDTDIIPFSATVNPLDWTTVDDAGYLPFGLQTHGANPVTAMGLYRSNLVAFNATGFQMWQVDQDPQNMALLDAAPIGCIEPRSIQPFQNDLVFLSAVGVRNISIAGASTNLQAGTFGDPIDPLVLAKIRAAEFTPISMFIPSFGQYWLVYGDEVFVLTLAGIKDVRWSRYTFPEAITDMTLLGSDLYLRTETHKVWKLTYDAIYDDQTTLPETDEPYGIDIVGIMQWPHLDFGALGVEKQFIGFDLIANADVGVLVSVGYDQRDLTARTTDYFMEDDSLTGQLVPLPLAGPSFDLRLTFPGGQAWEWQAAVIYIQDLRPGT